VNHAKDLIGAFMAYYATRERQPRYGQRMAEEMVDSLSWMGPRYKQAVYEEVLRTFVPTQMRPLPDMAAVNKAMKELPPPDTFRDYTQSNLIDAPLNVDANAEDRRAWTDLLEKMRRDLRGRKDRSGAYAPDEVDRVRRKAERGEASEYEQYWLRVMEEFSGDWEAARKTIGVPQ
jgi:hypothetical protein